MRKRSLGCAFPWECGRNVHAHTLLERGCGEAVVPASAPPSDPPAPSLPHRTAQAPTCPGGVRSDNAQSEPPQLKWTVLQLRALTT
jgi:hypothetical protein